jgi:hypothetical protein
MNTTIRFENAVEKLYLAFNNGYLNPECCKQCAVGNILDNKDFWKNLSDNHGSLELNYTGRVHQNLGRRFNGYSPLELMKIEESFLKGCGYQLPLHHKNKKPENPKAKEIVFNGLCAVVELLCKLDGIDNIIDYTKLFDLNSKSDSVLSLKNAS